MSSRASDRMRRLRLQDRSSPRAEAPAERVLGAIASGGARFERLITTRNRRVMISVGSGGRTLRAHELFLDAPAPVLEAVGTFFASRHGAKRSAAQRAIQAYIATVRPTASVPPRRRRTAAKPADLPYLADLAEEFRRVNDRYFGSALPEVPIRLSSRMRRRNGHFKTDPVEIAIARSLCTDAADGEARQTLRHEMIHLWQWAHGRRVDHGAEFRRWAHALAVHPRASRTVCWSPSSEG